MLLKGWMKVQAEVLVDQVAHRVWDCGANGIEGDWGGL